MESGYVAEFILIFHQCYAVLSGNFSIKTPYYTHTVTNLIYLVIGKSAIIFVSQCCRHSFAHGILYYVGYEPYNFLRYRPFYGTVAPNPKP